MGTGAHFLGEATWRLQVSDVRGSGIYQSHRHCGLDGRAHQPRFCQETKLDIFKHCIFWLCSAVLSVSGLQALQGMLVKCSMCGIKVKSEMNFLMGTPERNAGVLTF